MLRRWRSRKIGSLEISGAEGRSDKSSASEGMSEEGSMLSQLMQGDEVDGCQTNHKNMGDRQVIDETREFLGDASNC